jgi:hypothetical protein
MIQRAEQAEDQPRDRPFDDWRRPKSDAAKAVVSEITNELQNYETRTGARQRARKNGRDRDTFEQTVAAVVSDLIHRALTAPQGKLYIPLSNQVLGRDWNYRSPVLNQTVPDIIKHLASPELGWLVFEKGYRTPFVDSRRSTIAPSNRLLSRIERHSLTLDDLTRSRGEEIIIMKSRREDYWDRSAWVGYSDTADTQHYRAEVAQINDWLADADIDFDHTAAPGKVVDVDDRYLRRYFNDTFSHGGRLYGGFRQPLSKQARKAGLLIDGEQVATLDYCQMGPRLLYGMAGKQPPPGDLYAIPGLEGHRAGVKKLFSSMMFTDGLPTQYPKDCRELFPRRIAVGTAVSMIQDSHPDIAPFFGTDVGFKTMYQESEILIDILMELNGLGITALPIHDAIVVPQSDIPTAMQVMVDTFTKHTGVAGMVDIEGGSTSLPIHYKGHSRRPIEGVISLPVPA